MSQDKDELAKLLGEMAEGVHAEDEHAHADHDDHVGHLTEPPPPPATPAPPPKATPPAPVAKLPPTLPRPVVKPPSPKHAAPGPKAVTPSPPAAASPQRPAVKPALPPRPAPVVKPQTPAPTPKPLFTPPAQSAPLPTPIPELAAPAQTPIISDEEEPDRYSGTDDDAVIVPALAPADYARPKTPAPRRQHLSQKLYFKQTIIPILLTLGLICLAIPALGLLSSQYSPFKTLSEIYFLATFWPLGLAFLVFGLLTMLSVKKEIESHPPPAAET